MELAPYPNRQQEGSSNFFLLETRLGFEVAWHRYMHHDT